MLVDRSISTRAGVVNQAGAPPTSGKDDQYSEQLAWLGLAEANAPADKNLGSSDIGNVSQVVPTIHPHVPIGEGIHIHCEDFARATVSEQGQAAVLEGAVALALTATDLVASPEVRAKITDEFINS